ncbi:MAG: hypothetical protein ACOY3V_08235 [Pseudomonadota bacterium]
MNKLLGRATIMLAAMLAVNCATYRLSEQKIQEIRSQPHGNLAIKLPDGKAVDGYDEKWRLDVTVDGSRIVFDHFNDNEEYSLPVKAGEREIIVNIRREIDRPFRSAYVYFYPQMLSKKITIPENGTVNLTFALPEKKFGVGMFVAGIILTPIALIGWPVGAWPAFTAEAEPNYAVQGAATQPAEVKAPAKKKGK